MAAKERIGLKQLKDIQDNCNTVLKYFSGGVV